MLGLHYRQFAARFGAALRFNPIGLTAAHGNVEADGQKTGRRE
jgi:hypothetical protein